MRRLVVVGLGVAVCAALFIVLRPDDTDEPPGGVAITRPQTSAAPPDAPLPPARLVVAVRNGRPRGGIRELTVPRGRQVVLVVNADVRDHVHLHGYDLTRDVAPGRPTRITFRATIVGTVDAELEERRILLARITTRP